MPSDNINQLINPTNTAPNYGLISEALVIQKIEGYVTVREDFPSRQEQIGDISRPKYEKGVLEDLVNMSHSCTIWDDHEHRPLEVDIASIKKIVEETKILGLPELEEATFFYARRLYSQISSGKNIFLLITDEPENPRSSSYITHKVLNHLRVMQLVNDGYVHGFAVAFSRGDMMQLAEQFFKEGQGENLKFVNVDDFIVSGMKISEATALNYRVAKDLLSRYNPGDSINPTDLLETFVLASYDSELTYSTREENNQPINLLSYWSFKRGKERFTGFHCDADYSFSQPIQIELDEKQIEASAIKGLPPLLHPNKPYSVTWLPDPQRSHDRRRYFQPNFRTQEVNDPNPIDAKNIFFFQNMYLDRMQPSLFDEPNFEPESREALINQARLILSIFMTNTKRREKVPQDYNVLSDFIKQYPDRGRLLINRLQHLYLFLGEPDPEKTIPPLEFLIAPLFDMAFKKA